MPDTLKPVNALSTCLNTEIESVNRFLKVLQQEANVLSEGALDETLNQVTAQKNNCAAELEELASQRNNLLFNLGFEPDQNGLINAVKTYPELATLVQTLLDTTAQASIFNTGNGQIIERFLNHHKQALDVLHHLTGRSQLYDASGRTRPTSKPRTGHNKQA